MGDIYTNPPQSRNEAILRATIDGTEYTAPPQSRIEDLLIELKAAIEQSGGGTTVVANPEAAATDEVKKLQVGSTVYAVEDEAGRQLVEDTVGWEAINLADIPEADQRFTLVKSSLRYKYVILNKPISSGSYHLSIKISDIANLTSAVRIQLINDQSQAIWSDSTTMTADGKYDFDITLASAITKFYIFLRDTEADNATATISEIMITDPIYVGFPYQPYHETVEEALAGKIDNLAVAPVENGATCQNSDGYAVGDHFLRNGGYFTVTSAIAYGETITEGTNCVKGKISKRNYVTSISQMAAALPNVYDETIMMADSNCVAQITNSEITNATAILVAMRVASDRIRWYGMFGNSIFAFGIVTNSSYNVHKIAYKETETEAITTTNANVTLDSTHKNAVKNGKTVNYMVRFTIEANVQSDSAYKLFVMPYTPVLRYTELVELIDITNYQRSGLFALISNSNNGFYIQNYSDIPAGTYEVGGTYICQ